MALTKITSNILANDAAEQNINASGGTFALTVPVSFSNNLTLNGGTEAAPSYSFIGDPNTGMFTSGSDTLNFSTGGVERMRLVATGNVGVGTTSPSSKLDVNGTFNASGNATFLGTANISNNLTVDTNTLFVDAANNRVGVGTNTPNTTLTVVGQLSAVATATGTTPLIIKSISGQSVSSFIVQDGTGASVFNVGPSGNVSTGGRISVPNGTVSSPAINFNSSASTGMYLVTTNTLAFATSGVNALTIDPNRNVGIGTTSPNEKLTVVGSLSATGGLSLAYVLKTSNYTITNNDYTIDCNGTFTVTLPTTIGITGKIFNVKNSGSGTITLSTTSNQTIDGSLTASINSQWASISVQSTGANWIII